MKSLFSGCMIAFSMYSAIPVPQIQWEKENMRWAFCFLPLIGLIIGAIEWLWYVICRFFSASVVFYSVFAALLPLLISGGIHMDGFTDSCDALCSWGDREKKLAILKDPHVGAFGPMWMMAFLLAEAACFAQLYDTPLFLPVACIGFPIARALGGLKVITMSCAKDSGLAYLFAAGSDRKVVVIVLGIQTFLLLAAALMLRPDQLLLAFMIAAVLPGIWYMGHARLCRRHFGGITGDLAGFFITGTEGIVLFASAIGGLLT